MKGYNKVMLMGYLGKDPDVRYMQNGDPVANFSMATTDYFKDKNTGENKEKTEWHNVVVFSGPAEAIGNHLRKGSAVFVEGKLTTRKWQDNDGNNRYTTEVVVDRYRGTVSFLDRTSGGESAPAQKSKAKAKAKPAPEPDGNQADFDDDIPF